MPSLNSESDDLKTIAGIDQKQKELGVEVVRLGLSLGPLRTQVDTLKRDNYQKSLDDIKTQAELKKINDKLDKISRAGILFYCCHVIVPCFYFSVS